MTSSFPAAEHSAEFRKVLGVRDLVLAQLISIVGLTWVGVAAKMGPSHAVFWILGVTLFYLPSTAVVVYLNRLHPLEGGLYTWARLGFNDFVGFITAWMIWLNCVVLVSEVGIQTVTILGYALGPRVASFSESRWVLAAATLLMIGAIGLVARVGLDIGKWVTNAGGIVMLVIFAALIALPFRNLALGRLREYHPLALTMPTVSLLSLNLLGKIGFGALSGCEYVAIFAGECRDAARSIGRAVLIAAPMIALMFILGTSAVRAFVPENRVDLVSPISQTLEAGTRAGDPGAGFIPFAILGVLASALAQQNFNFAAASRLPLVAGWDHLLPKWFTRLHPRHRTPSNSILFIGVVTFGLGILSLVGAGEQEAFQLLQSAAMTFYAFAYLVMFALPLIGFRNWKARPPLWLRGAAVSGFLMTLLSVVLSIFPIIDVPNPAAFMAKVGAVIVGCIVLGAVLFFSCHRRARRLSMENPPE